MEGGKKHDALFKTMKKIPNPKVTKKGNGIVGGFIDNKAVHEQVGQVIKHGISEYMGKGVFGGSINSAFGGISESFLGGLAEDVKNKETKLKEELKSLQSVAAFIEMGFDKIIESSDKGGKKVIETIKSNVMEKFVKAIDTINTLTTSKVENTDKMIKQMIEKHMSFGEVLDLIGDAEDGTKKKSDQLAILTTIAYDLSDLGMKVDEALHAIDMKESEYKKYVSKDDLRTDVIKKIVKTKDVEVVEKMLEAYDVLEKNFHVKNGKGVLGGLSYKEDNIGRIEDDDDSDDEDNNKHQSLGHEIKKKQNLYKKILKLFVQDLASKFSGIKDCIDILSKSFNTSIHYNETIERFIDTFSVIDVNDDPTNYIELIDIKHTENAATHKALFVDNLTILIKICDKIISEQEDKKVFTTIRDLLKDINKSIDNYSDTIINSRKEILLTTPRNGLGVEGGISGNEYELTSFDVNDIIISNNLSIKDSIDKIKFYGNIAKIRANLKYSKNDITNYSKNYPELLGESIGQKITQVRKSHMSVVNSINNDKTGIGYYIKEFNKTTKSKKIDKKMLIKISNWQYDTKEKFYKTIEVVDLFLMNFTTDVVGNPEVVSDIHNLIKTVQTATQWYGTDSSAKNLNNLLGKPNLLDSIDIGDDFFDSIDKCKKVLHSVTVLKNVISWFIYMDKLSSKKLLMAPNVIYKNLVNYLCASTYVCGFNNLYLNSKEDGLEDIDDVDPSVVIQLILNATFATNECPGTSDSISSAFPEEFKDLFTYGVPAQVVVKCIRMVTKLLEAHGYVVTDPEALEIIHNMVFICIDKYITRETINLADILNEMARLNSFDRLSISSSIGEVQVRPFSDSITSSTGEVAVRPYSDSMSTVRSASSSLGEVPVRPYSDSMASNSSSVGEVAVRPLSNSVTSSTGEVAVRPYSDSMSTVRSASSSLGEEPVAPSGNKSVRWAFPLVYERERGDSAANVNEFDLILEDINSDIDSISDVSSLSSRTSSSLSTISAPSSSSYNSSNRGSSISSRISSANSSNRGSSISSRISSANSSNYNASRSNSVGSMPSLLSDSSASSRSSVLTGTSSIAMLGSDASSSNSSRSSVSGLGVGRNSCVASTDPKDQFKKLVAKSASKLSEADKKILVEKYMNCDQYTTNVFEDDDIYFVYLLKAIAGKVLTTIGTYTLYNNKEDVTTIITNPIRLIMGGSSDIEVMTDATELYVRLPLLVEYYRELFEDGNRTYKTSSTFSEEETIAYIPDMSGIWSGLINTIFDKSKFITQGFYDDEITKTLIREINKIYKHYLSVDKNNAVNNTIMGLIGEVNRRYGILKKNDIQKYYEALKNYTYDNPVVKNVSIPGMNDSNNYNILDDNDDTVMKTPSDKFIKNEVSLQNLLLKSKKNKTFTHDLPLITNLYQKINNSLKRISSSSMTKNKSFKNYIKLYKTELENTTDSEKRVSIVINAIKNLTTEKKENKNTYLLFIELVVIPLEMLNNLYEEYRYFVESLFLSIDNYYALLSSADKKVFDTIVTKSDGTKFTLNHGVGINSLVELLKFTSQLDNGLSEFKLTNDGNVLFTWSKLETTVNNLITNIKLALGKFIHVIDDSILKDIYDESKLNSLFYIEKHFLNHLIRSNFVNNDRVELTLEDVTQMSGIMTKLIKNPSIGLDLYNEIIFNEYIDSGDNVTPRTPGSDMIKLTRSLPFHYDAFRYYENRRWMDPDLNIKNKLYDPKASHHSLVELFNSTLSSYLNIFYDESLKKFYNKLTSTFYNSHVTDVNGFLDFTNSKATYGPGLIELLSAVPNGSFISALNVEAMKVIYNRIISSTSPSSPNNKFHIIENITDVSPYVIERYIDTLPRFKVIFETIIKQALIYKQLISANNKMDFHKAKEVFIEIPGPVFIDKDDALMVEVKHNKMNELQEASVGQNLKSAINSIIDYSRSLITDIDNVLVEIKDSSKSQFMDLRKDYVKNYKANINEEPFTPASLVYSIINGNKVLLPKAISNGDENSVLIPYIGNTIEQKKLSYGIKSFLDKSVKLSELPYTKKLLSYYSSYSYDYNKLDDKVIKNIYSELSDLYYGVHSSSLKAYVNGNFYKNSVNGAIGRFVSFNTDLFLSNDTMVELIEDTSLNASRDIFIKNTFKRLAKPASVNNRSESRLINIIDLNVVPINIHALLKEVPLINIYNYAYTYDNCVRSLKMNGSLQKFLLNPHDCHQEYDIYNILASPINGISNGELSSSKFLVDVLADKVLNNDTENKFNTKLVTNLSFITMLQRIIRISIRDSLDLLSANVKIVTGGPGLDKRIVSYD